MNLAYSVSSNRIDEGTRSPPYRRAVLTEKDDVLIMGAGVIGLSLADELARRGMQVRIIDRGQPGREASWAGAGILPPATSRLAVHPYDQLRALSFQLHEQWAERLRDETGIDNGYRVCGGLYLARSEPERVTLQVNAQQWQDEGIAIEHFDAVDVGRRWPALAQAAPAVKAAIWMPEEAQLRNPWHLRALVASCRRQGVRMNFDQPVDEILVEGSRVLHCRSQGERYEAANYCITSGAWSYSLLGRLGIQTGLMPVRGQMLLFRLDSVMFEPIVNEGSRYLVPREDGHVLVGSTEEETGFDQSTTSAARDDLMHFSQSICPSLNENALVAQWSGLRPGTFDGFPYLGPLPELDNAFVAAGHFRSGILHSTGTAVVMSDLIACRAASIDLHPFRPSRR